jgi:hypothetical protein
MCKEYGIKEDKKWHMEDRSIVKWRKGIKKRRSRRRGKYLPQLTQLAN